MKSYVIVVLALLFLVATPSAVAQWVQTSGPRGGYVHQLAADDSYLYATSHCATFRMAIGDTTWIALPGLNHPLNVGASCLLVDGSILRVGASGAGVFSSSDHGMTWQRWITGLEGGAGGVGALALRGDTLLAGTVQGVYRSTDKGLHWTPSNDGIAHQNVMTLLNTDSMIFAGTFEGGLFRANEIGATWVASDSGLPDQRVFALMEFGGAVFAGSWGDKRISISTDYGTSWQARNVGLTTSAVNTLTAIGTILFAGSHGGVYRSTNSGATWDRPTNQPGIGVDFQVISTDLYVATYDGVHLSTDGGNHWKDLRSGFIGTEITSMLRVGTTLFAGTPLTLYRSEDDGDSWTKTSLLQGRVHAVAFDGTYLYAASSNNLLRSSDGGNLWIYTAPVGVFRPVTSLAVVQDAGGGSHLFAATDSCGVYRSSDAGDSWVPFKAGLQDTLITCLANRDTVIFAGTTTGVFAATLSSTGWTPAKSGLGDVGISCLAVCGDALLAGTHGMGIFRSTDSGISWTADTVGLTDLDVFSITVSGTKIFAGTWFGGLYVSDETADHWTAHNTDLRQTAVYSGVASTTDLFVGTRGAGVWRRPLSEMISPVEDREDGLPSAFFLEQNYPNPFNPETAIIYHIGKAGFVRLRVFDFLGRVVADLVNERQGAGTYTARFDASGLSSGVYFCRLESGKTRQTRKMLYLR